MTVYMALCQTDFLKGYTIIFFHQHRGQVLGKRSVENVKNYFSFGIYLASFGFTFLSPPPYTKLGSHVAFSCHLSLVS